MKRLQDFKEEIHKCSKCGICQSECPIYKITGNDCTVSRGQFVMLNGVVKGDLKMSKVINRYLDLCLKCGKCSKVCPSGVDVVDVIVTAKYEYFRKHFTEKLSAFIKKYFIFGFIPRFESLFKRNAKSKTFGKKVLYFGGCSSKFRTDKAVIKLLNEAEMEVINPVFHCCGIPLFAMGDLDGFKDQMKKYINILKKYDIKEVVTTCTSCEKTIKSYIKWVDDEDKEFLSGITVKNIFEYLRDKKLKLKTPRKVTYHKPCSLENWEDVEQVLKNTENLEYVEMKGFDKCCGLNGLDKFNEYKILKEIYKEKRKNIVETGAEIVLSSCLGCDTALKLYSSGKYKVDDLTEFLGNNI